jgi:hypothetical protein
LASPGSGFASAEVPPSLGAGGWEDVSPAGPVGAEAVAPPLAEVGAFEAVRGSAESRSQPAKAALARARANRASFMEVSV